MTEHGIATDVLTFNVADYAVCLQAGPIVTISKGEPGTIRWGNRDGEFYDMPVSLIPDVIATLARLSLEASNEHR